MLRIEKQFTSKCIFYDIIQFYDRKSLINREKEIFVGRRSVQQNRKITERQAKIILEQLNLGHAQTSAKATTYGVNL